MQSSRNEPYLVHDQECAEAGVRLSAGSSSPIVQSSVTVPMLTVRRIISLRSSFRVRNIRLVMKPGQLYR